jgi:23S rRNA (pseudouridine1915-N3)-methyltransferase
MITIVAVGKKHEEWIENGLERYEKRLRAPFDAKWVLLPHSSKQGDEARQDESERILATVSASDYVVLLDEAGRNITSPTLSAQLESQFNHSKRPVIIIGGAYGVDERVRARADFTWSLSKLVFPHQLVRLIAIEQIYRAQSIASGTSYHHD